MKNNQHDKRWMERVPEGQQPSDDQIRRSVAQDQDRFLQAKKRAMQAIEEESAVPLAGFNPGRLGWLAVGVAALACIIFFSVSENKFAVPNLIATPAVAGYKNGIEGRVLSSHDMKPVWGVEVYEQIKGESKQRRLVDITSTFGIFNAPPVATGKIVELTFVYEGKDYETLVIDSELHDSMGYARVLIDLHPEQINLSAEVKINPGESLKALPGVHLSLAKEAAQSWSGTVILDRNWPGYFAYLQCLEGLLRIEGQGSEYLSVTLDVEQDKLELNQTNFGDLKIVTFSQKYLVLQDEDNETSWRAAAHNGWYDIADEYLFELDQDAHGVQYQVPQFRESAEAVSVSWNPEIGKDYVLVAPVQSDGRNVACWYSCFRGNDHRWYPTIKLVDRTKRITSFFEYRYYPIDEDGYYTDANMLDRNESNFHFYRGRLTRNHAPSAEGLDPLLEDNTFAKLDGMFQLVRYDLSLSNPVAYPLIEADFSNPPGDYEVVVEKHSLGENTILTVTGDTSRLARSPQWDFYGDYIFDTQGLSTNFRPTHTGEYAYKVFLEEKCGNVVILERMLRFPAQWAIGYEMIERDLLVIKGEHTAPETPSSLTVYSEYAVSSPAAYGVSTGMIAGPVLCIDPPDDFRGVPLKEMTVHIFARGVAGDYRKMPLRLFAAAETKQEELDELGLWQFEDNVNFSRINVLAGKKTLDPSRLAWEIRSITRDIIETATDGDVAKLLQTRILSLDNPRYNKYFRDIVGIDLENLKSESNLAKRLLAFKESPYLCLQHMTDELTDWVSKIDLCEGVMVDDDYILVRIKMEDAAMPYAAQWELYSGGDTLSRVEIEAEDGRMFTTYFDYAPVVE